jgi:putative transposase
VRRAYKFRAWPTRGQEQRARAYLAGHRELYTAALEERWEAWRHGVTIHYGDQSGQLRDIRRDDPDGQARWSFTSQQQTLRRPDRAFRQFFHRVQASPRAGYPRFKSVAPWDPVDFVNGDCTRWRGSKGAWATAYLKGVGHLKVKAHRPVAGRVKTLRLKCESRR